MPCFQNGVFYSGDVPEEPGVSPVPVGPPVPAGPPVFVSTRYTSQGDVDAANRALRVARDQAAEARHALAAQRHQTRRADSAVSEAEALARRYWTGEQARIDLQGEEEQRYEPQAGRLLGDHMTMGEVDTRLSAIEKRLGMSGDRAILDARARAMNERTHQREINRETSGRIAVGRLW